MSWCTIESDPGVFTELIAEMGVKGVQVEELYDLSDETFNRLKPIYGLIFLFKWRREEDARACIEDPCDVFFARQMIENACATQAIINCLLNRPDVDVGEALSNYKQFTSILPPDMRGLALDEVNTIRMAHNSFARPEPFVVEEKRAATSDDEAYHFIAYVPVNGNLYELDGLKAGPILLDECTDENWLDQVRPHIQNRINKYASNEIRFNLMALIRNRKEVFEQKLEQINQRVATVQAKLSGDAMDVADDLPSTPDELKTMLSNLEFEAASYRTEITEEEFKFKKWKVENIRRKHNYIPFIFNMLKVLAERNQLMPLVEASVKKQSSQMTKK
eukprot:TRINITY_DN1981_c0_g9_i1.p1 TRINITY_DN1981_c0_g9~~TRINITY_DN1981_c0_g9_i1.p1  ORF type:complete len:333 (+),score=102.34 TRINITY_DN1981_c0_g9_i1:66-1064(+)